MNKKLFVKTWGCQMNVYDSNKMTDILAPLGYTTVSEPDDADMIILNTCHIREKATEKVFSELGRLRKFKEKSEESKGEKVLLAVAGCVAQAEGDIIMDRAPYVDMVFGPQTYHELPEMVAKSTGAYGDKRVVNTEFPVISKFDSMPDAVNDGEVTAFLSVQEGCDKFCTFCVVPYTRGAEFSRSVQQIIDEAIVLTKKGVRELTLLGQNVNAYHGEGLDGEVWGLGQLVRELAKIDDLKRIRYTTSHPRDMDMDLIETHRDEPKLMPFLHLPVQAGSDKVLKEMNRKHTSDEYREIIKTVREHCPDIAMSSDFIVGFPGETEEDFQDTMQIVKDIGYAFCYSFKYSPRPGTTGAKMGGMVAEHLKTKRLHQLQALLEEQQINYNKSWEGKTVSVLFDRKGKNEGQLHGRTPHNLSVYADANDRLIGQEIDVKLIKAGRNGLTGEIVVI